MGEVENRLKGQKKPRRPTLTADKNAATALHSLIVRARGACQRCGVGCACPQRPAKHLPRPACPLECSHIMSRSFAATRTDERNAFCLCSGCHREFTANPIGHAAFASELLGVLVLHDLQRKAYAGIQGNSSVFWREERQRLTEAFAAILEAAA